MSGRRAVFAPIVIVLNARFGPIRRRDPRCTRDGCSIPVLLMDDVELEAVWVVRKPAVNNTLLHLNLDLLGKLR